MKASRFNTEEVRAILDGRKTQTRWAVKPHVVDKFVISKDGRLLGSYGDGEEEGYPTVDDAQYQVGDILYVQETWRAVDYQFIDDVWSASIQFKDMEIGERVRWKNGDDTIYERTGWRPSIHMPKEVARLFLRVTGVRVERLQDISDGDAIAEGFTGLECEHLNGLPCADRHNSGWIEPPMVDFMYAWDSKIKKSGLSKYGWDANPWVWVYEFEACEKAEVQE